MDTRTTEAIARALEDMTARLHTLEAERLAARSALLLLVRRMGMDGLVDVEGLCEDMLKLVSVNEAPDGAELRSALASLAHDLMLACLPPGSGERSSSPPRG